MDPAKGRIVMNRDEFNREWSKTILIMYPRMKIISFNKENSLLSMFLKVLLSEKRLLFYIIVASIFMMIFTIASSYYFQVMIDGITSNYYVAYLRLFAVIFGVIVLLKLLFMYFRNYLENHLNKNIDCVLNASFLEHTFNLPLEIILSRTSGEIITRVNELGNIKSLFTEIFISCILDFLLMFASVPLLISISKDLFLALFLCLILYLFIGLISSKIVFKKAYHNIELEANFNNDLLENINMINSIKNLNVTSSRLKKIEESLSKFLYDTFLLSSFLNKEKTLKNWISEIGFFAINTWGFYLIFQGRLEITALVTFNTLLGFFLDPIKNCIDSIPKYNYLRATYAKINDFLSNEQEKMGKAIYLKDNSIKMENITYSYNDINNILNNFNLQIKGGEFVVFKGQSGCGKSTLCKMLDKYITNYKGDILIGSINIKDLSIATIRKNILYVNQNENIITDTIRNNILLDRNIPEKIFFKICKLCAVDEIVKRKPLRYNTIIGNEIGNISGGELQRIILARALLNNFQILILDEALSEVDYKMEEKIMINIRNYFKDKTIICITHKNHDKLFDRVINVGGYNEL
jgi:ABC-type bacteriocin/lantibiotic exporter with double-glycine peptidase domain